MNRQTISALDGHDDEPSGSQGSLSLALMRDAARRSLTNTRDAIAAPGDDGRSVPLPVPGVADVTIGQALEAAFLHLETLKQQAGGAVGSDVDPLDWSEDLLEAVDLTHLSRAKR